MNPLHYRILEISYKHKLSHLGSNLGAVDIIDDIYSQRKPDDPFILSSGHAGLALYVVLEKYFGLDAEKLFLKHGVHPNKDSSDKIYCSTGSLGLGLPIAIGHAIGNPDKNIWCLISDGESAEGSIYESFNLIRRLNLNNIKVYINHNGYGAYYKTDWLTENILKSLLPKIIICKTSNSLLNTPFLNGLDAHYYVMTEKDWELVQQLRKL